MTRTLATLGILIVLAGCADAPRAIAPDGAAFDAAALAQTSVAGSYVASIDFTTISLTPRGQNCLLEVEGQLEFTGSIVGTATGRTSALVFATCEEAATTPPGTHPDVFRSVLEFEGTVNGEPATADLQYMGRVAPGGALDGRLVFSNGISGRLDADGIVAVGGTYSGDVVVH